MPSINPNPVGSKYYADVFHHQYREKYEESFRLFDRIQPKLEEG
jgi:hypothetical protein